MKGILLAGGAGTRLFPVTQVQSKQLLPVYDKPMIYYPLAVLMLANIKEICVISTPRDLPRFRELLGNGQQWGLTIDYREQPTPEGIAQAFLIAEDFIDRESVCLILGDNLFYGVEFGELLQRSKNFVKEKDEAATFGYTVSNPEDYGVAEINQEGQVISLEEKPLKPKSDCAVTGLYMYPGDVADQVRTLRPSDRGELEITALNECYLRANRLRLTTLGRGFAWLDTGSHDSLLDAGHFIATIERRQGLKIGCVEEIAWRKGWLSKEMMAEIIETLGSSSYGMYLRRIWDKDLNEVDESSQ
jgi:glucose-1-phosphate thymidylyltransferase